MREAMKFPIIASVFLFGFYLLYKFVNKDIVNFLITLQFCLATVISTSNMLLTYVNFSESMKKVIRHVNPYEFLKKYLDFSEFDISIASIITTGLCSIPVILFYITKHWFLNNVFGILFSIVALKSINLSSFKVGFILLWILFFYDIFWVYGTDVMVTVAKNLDIPIKLVFPYLNAEGEEKFSMLGLGDIVVPGIFVALCLKFDIDKALLKLKIKKTEELTTPYFNTCMIGYFLGIVETFAVMWIWEHPQPALLFLVPMCTLPVAGLGFVKKEFKELE
jgi:minor histocompatibility antigen H13